MGAQPGADVPEESNEMRESMPKAAMYRQAQRMREVANEHYVAPPPLETREATVTDADGNETTITAPVDDGIARGRFADPRHVGLRHHAVSKEMAAKPMDEWDTPQEEGTR